MARTKKKEMSDKSELRTEELGVSSVYFFADSELMSKIYIEDLTRIKKSFGVRIDVNDNKITAISTSLENCRKAIIVVEKMFDIIDRFGAIEEEELTDLIKALIFKPLANTKYKAVYTTPLGDDISPRTESQELMIKHIRNKTITVAHGCAGTGKSKMALVMGLKYIEENRFDKIIIVRPMITVGAPIGFLPGGLNQKYFPYTSPIYDALCEMLGEREVETRIKSKKIDFAPVGLTRGANFQNAYIIIDEAQNLSKVETLTLLTRIGYNTKIVVTGDESQSDRKGYEKSGLEYCVERLGALDSVGFVKMTIKDIQRHQIITDIITGFEG